MHYFVITGWDDWSLTITKGVYCAFIFETISHKAFIFVRVIALVSRFVIFVQHINLFQLYLIKQIHNQLIKQVYNAHDFTKPWKIMTWKNVLYN